MKLVFYSGGYSEENWALDEEMLSICLSTNPVFTYIPSLSDEDDEDYAEFTARFSGHGVRKFQYLPVDMKGEFDYIKLMRSDLVFLAGGNTFYFSKSLRAKGLFSFLRSFISQGGVLAGESAGAIIMSPRIDAASYPTFDCDENEVGLENWNGLKLVKFDFFPHFSNTKRYIHELNIRSKYSHDPIYACSDGSGIIIDGPRRVFHGECWGFFRGKKFKL
jgi:dipeptidase E